MKTIAITAAALVAGLTLASAVRAEEPDATTQGTVAGAATGALVGGPVGAVVGGAMGMTTGAIIDDASKPKTETVIIKKQQPVVVDEGRTVTLEE
jgi:outer membrane lipoprotein SlyB